MNNDKWEYMFFRDALPITMGKTPPRGDSDSWDVNKKTKNKWVSIADISSNEGKYIFDTKEYISDIAASKIHQVKKGSLLMSFKLSIGKMAFAGTDLYTNEAIIAIPHNDRYLLRFLYYYFLSYHWNTLTDGNEKVKGATLNKKTIGEIKLPITSLSDQQEIVDYLDKAFAKIDALKKNAEQQLSDAKALFSAALEESMTPQKGWDEKTLKDISIISGNYGLNAPSKPFDGIRYLRITDITDNGELNEEKVSADISGETNQALLEEGDILFARTGATVGKTLMYRNEFGDCLFAGYLIRYRVNKHIVDPKFVFYIAHTPEYFKWVQANQKAAAQPNISAKLYSAYPIHFPSLPEQQTIVAHLDALSATVNQLQENYNKILRECDALKQALLREIFEQ